MEEVAENHGSLTFTQPTATMMGVFSNDEAVMPTLPSLSPSGEGEAEGVGVGAFPASPLDPLDEFAALEF